MKCWNPAFNSQVAVDEGAAEGAQEKGKTEWNSSYRKNWLFFDFHASWMLMYFFLLVFSESHPVYYQTQGFGAVFFPYFMDNSIIVDHFSFLSFLLNCGFHLVP